MSKKDEIDVFCESLKQDNVNITEGMNGIRKSFLFSCKECGSKNIFVSWEEGTDYGGYTGYCPGQKLFKCIDCGNAVSFYE